MKKVIFAALTMAALIFAVNSAYAYSGDELLAVRDPNSQKYGYAEKNGKIKIPYMYNIANDFSCGAALVGRSGKLYYIDAYNRVMFNSDTGEYRFYYNFSEDLCVASKNGKFGYLNKDGSVAIDFIYDDAYSFCEGLACVSRDGRAGYIDREGKTAVDFIYDDGESFKEGLARVNKNGRYGFIDKSGRRCVPVIYETAAEFCEGVSCVKLGGMYTYVGKNGYIYFPPVFEEAKSFKNGSALVKINGKYGRIRLDGTYKVMPKFDSYREFHGKYAVAGKYDENGNLLFGITDEYANRVTPMIYEKIIYNDGVYAMYRNGKTVFVDDELNEIVPDDTEMLQIN